MNDTSTESAAPRWRHIGWRARGAALLAGASLLLLARCASGPAAAARHGDEIVAVGQPFRIGTPVVLWTDDGGYDAYATQKRFKVEAVPDGKVRYRPIRADLPTAIAERVLNSDWTLADLQQVVHLFVIHFDVAGTSRQCFKVLQDARNLSVHFMLDTDGTIYQTLDLQEQAYHATYANACSIGVEIAHPGCWPRDHHPDMLRWYGKDEHGWFMKFPKTLGETGLRTKDFVPRPDRNEVFSGTINGSTLYQLDFTPQQYEALAHLCAAVHRVFPRIRLECPRDSSGNVIPHNLERADMLAFDGVVGHYHVQHNKPDPGPAFQWDRLLRDARAIAAADK